MGRLEGKGAVVLGAAGRDNMGQVIARRFAAEGAKVLVAGRKEDELARFAGEIGGHWAACDITRRDDVFALAETAKAKLGKVQIGVNATGWGLLKPFLENTEEGPLIPTGQELRQTTSPDDKSTKRKSSKAGRESSSHLPKVNPSGAFPIPWTSVRPLGAGS
eukprot:gene10534-14151_t